VLYTHRGVPHISQRRKNGVWDPRGRAQRFTHSRYKGTIARVTGIIRGSSIPKESVAPSPPQPELAYRVHARMHGELI